MSVVIAKPRIYKPSAPPDHQHTRPHTGNETQRPLSEYMCMYIVNIIFGTPQPIFNGFKEEIK